MQENHTQVEKSIEEHALLASNFALFDALENSIPFPDATEDTTSKSKESQSSDNTGRFSFRKTMSKCKGLAVKKLVGCQNLNNPRDNKERHTAQKFFMSFKD